MYKYNTASLLVYNNMGWLGDSAHRGQGCQAWTKVGLLPRYPPSNVDCCSADPLLTSTCGHGQTYTHEQCLRMQADTVSVHLNDSRETACVRYCHRHRVARPCGLRNSSGRYSLHELAHWMQTTSSLLCCKWKLWCHIVGISQLCARPPSRWFHYL